MINAKDKNKFISRFDKDNGPKHETSWERYFDKKHPKHSILRKRFDLTTSHVVGPKVLDIGCGSGLGSFLAAKKDTVDKVIAVDVWEATLNRAKKFISSQTKDIQKKISFYKAFAEDLPFADNSFDCIVMGEVLEHVYSDTEAAKEAYRVCKNGGTIIASVPNMGRISADHLRIYDKDIFLKLISKHFSVTGFNAIGGWLWCSAKK